MNAAAQRLIDLGCSHSRDPRGFLRVYTPKNLYQMSSAQLHDSVKAIYDLGLAVGRGEVIEIKREGSVIGWLYGRTI